MSTASRAMLVLGATGHTGSRVVALALQQGWRVSTFVRNPNRLPEDVRKKVTVITGDLNDADAVRGALRASQPDVLVDASSALPFGHAKGQPANSADRSILLHAVVDELTAEGRLADCNFLIVGGQLVAEPGGTINTLFARVLEWALATLLVPTAWAAAKKAIQWLWTSAPAFRFTMLRMGSMAVAPSRGRLQAETTEGGNYPKSEVSYDDVAACIMELANDDRRPGPWSRRAVYLNYAAAAQ